MKSKDHEGNLRAISYIEIRQLSDHVLFYNINTDNKTYLTPDQKSVVMSCAYGWKTTGIQDRKTETDSYSDGSYSINVYKKIQIMKTLITFGVFDILHIGHILLFKHAKDLFPEEDCKLIVAVQDGDCILKYKPGTKMVYTTEERMFMVNSIYWVDKVVTYRDVDIDIQNINFDVFVKGPDQQHAGFQRAVEWCKANGKQIVVIPRTEGVSSTDLRSFIASDINDKSNTI